MIALLALAVLLAAGIAGVAVFLLKLQREGQNVAAGGDAAADVVAPQAVGPLRMPLRSRCNQCLRASACASSARRIPSSLMQRAPMLPDRAGRRPARRHGPHARGSPEAAARRAASSGGQRIG
jgi:uncharacterized membrane protein